MLFLLANRLTEKRRQSFLECIKDGKNNCFEQVIRSKLDASSKIGLGFVSGFTNTVVKNLVDRTSLRSGAKEMLKSIFSIGFYSILTGASIY